jgi:Ca2+-binding EF-hand superfamily protein
LQSEKDTKEEIIKAFKLFDDDGTVSCKGNEEHPLLSTFQA